MDTRGYLVGGFIVDWNYNQASHFLICPDLTMLAQVVVVLRRHFLL